MTMKIYYQDGRRNEDTCCSGFVKIKKWQWRYIIKMVGEIRIHAAADLDVKCAGNSWKTGKFY